MRTGPRSANWAGTNKPPASIDSLVFSATSGPAMLGNTLTSSTFSFANITFTPGALAYTMTGNTFYIKSHGNGIGAITNNSGYTQTFSNSGGLGFFDDSDDSSAFYPTNGNIVITGGLNNVSNTSVGGQALTVTGSSSLVLGGLQLTGESGVTNFTINGNGNVLITGAVTPGLSTTCGLIWANAGTLTLAASNTYTGATTIYGGGTVALTSRALPTPRRT